MWRWLARVRPTRLPPEPPRDDEEPYDFQLPMRHSKWAQLMRELKR